MLLSATYTGHVLKFVLQYTIDAHFRRMVLEQLKLENQQNYIKFCQIHRSTTKFIIPMSLYSRLVNKKKKAKHAKRKFKIMKEKP